VKSPLEECESREHQLSVNELLVAEVSPLDEAENVSVPDLLIERSENVATPPAAVIGEVPERLPDPLPSDMATSADEVVTTRPDASSTLTTTAGEIVVPWVPLVGCVVKASLLATPVILNVAPVTLVRPELAAVKVIPVP
jgi:hypothetical protein